MKKHQSLTTAAAALIAATALAGCAGQTAPANDTAAAPAPTQADTVATDRTGADPAQYSNKGQESEALTFAADFTTWQQLSAKNSVTERKSVMTGYLSKRALNSDLATKMPRLLTGPAQRTQHFPIERGDTRPRILLEDASGTIVVVYLVQEHSKIHDGNEWRVDRVYDLTHRIDYAPKGPIVNEFTYTPHRPTPEADPA